MNEKEIAEIRRHLKPDKSNISTIRGCYVNDQQEIISEFSQSMALLPEDETEKFMGLLKRTLSGTLDKNLIGIEFSTQQVVEGEEHRLLMALRDSQLKDDAAVQAFFQRVIHSVAMEDSYLILLACDVYDVFYRAKDDERQDEASSEVFSYVLCSICPVKMTKPALSYYVYENEFHSRAADRIVSPPELGFMFPAFDDRSTNIYGALFHTRDIAESHSDFVNTVFGCAAPMPAAEQKETFQVLLGNTLTADCSYDVVHAVHGQLQEMIEEHKASKEPEPLKVSKSTVRRILKENGVSDENVAAFDERFDDEFGPDASLSPRNIVDTKQLVVTTPDVTIQISPGCGDLLDTRVIDGGKYILVRVEGDVELNGVPIQIS